MAKVLLVEDDNNLREIYQARLEAEGYDITAARDGEEALVIAKQVNPDLIVSDVMMPKISGFEMLDILRNTEGMKQVKVIMLTALGQSEDQSRADSLGADRYLVKSQVTLEDIVNAAHDLLTEAGAVEAEPAEPTPAVAATAPVALATPPPEVAVQPAPPVAAPAPEPIVEPAPTSEPVAPEPAPVETPTIPLAAPPADSPETMPQPGVSMPPTPVSTTPVDDFSAAAAAPAPEPVAQPTPDPVQEPVAPAPEPVQEPALNPIYADPTPTANEVTEDAQTVVNNEQLTEAQEEASVEQQIENFIGSQSGQPLSEVDPANEPVAGQPEVTQPETAPPQGDPLPAANIDTPQPEPQPELAPTTTPEQEQALDDALESLGGSAEPADAATTPAVTSDEPKKKVIAPLGPIEGTTPQKSLEELLAIEEADEPAPTAAPATVVPPAPAPEPATPAAPMPAPVQLQQPPKPPAANNDFDPNSIAL